MDDADFWDDHPHPTDELIREVCEAWLSYQHEAPEGGVDETNPNWWACMAVQYADKDPSLQWRLIRCLCAVAEPDDSAIAMIGIGPIESMIFDDSARAMDLIEAVADGDPILLTALESVWCFDEPARPRIDALLARHGRSRR